MSVTNWLLRKVRGLNQERMKKHIDIIQKNSGKSKFYIYLSIFGAFLARGAGYTDYFRGDFIHRTKAERDTFVTAKSFYQILQYLNQENYKVLVDDKIVFNQFFGDYIHRDYLNLREAGVEEFKAFIRGREVVFAKTPKGEGGHGVSKIVLADYPDKAALYRLLLQRGQLLVEEAIVQSAEVNRLNPCVVNSFRVITLYKDGKVTLLNNAFRINQDSSEVIGCSNDLYFSLSADGRIDSNVIDDYGNIYTEHPMTGVRFADIRVSGVDKAFAMCVEAAKKIPQVRYIGWDVAFSEKGPILVEGNQYPGYGIVQFYRLKDKHTGHLKEIADVLGDEMKNIKL